MKKDIIFIGGAILLLILLVGGWWFFSRPERRTTGSVSTQFRWIGPNDKVVVDGFDDPKVQGVTCHISRAQTGGVKGALGVAEDTSDASISCRQIGPIKFQGELVDGERSLTNSAALFSSRYRLCAFLTARETSLSMCLTATGSFRAVRRTASARCPSWDGKAPDRIMAGPYQ